MHSSIDSLPARALHWLAEYVYRYPRWFFYPQVVLMVVSIFYTVAHLKINTSRDDLVGAEKTYHKNFLRFKKEFSGQDDLIAIVESEDLEKNRQFVERLGARVERETNIFTDVFYKGDLKMMGPKALLFLPEETLADLLKTLNEYRPFIESFAKTTNLNAIFRMVNQQFRAAAVQPTKNDQSETLIAALPALTRIVNQAADSLNRPGTAPSPGITALFNAGEKAEQEQYVTFANGRIFLVSARPLREDVNARAVERLRALVYQTQAEVAGVNVGITGEAVLEIDEMTQAERDSTVATVISLVLAALIFITAYKETGRPIKATACLVVGLAYTLGYTTLTVGHLNILTVTFLPILIGLAIDFGVHLITRYEEELRRGESERDALEKAMVNTGMGIFTGCFTTAGAFFAMGLTDFKGIREMGIITGGGMVICLLPMVTLLPVLILRGRQNVMDHWGTRVEKRARIESFWLDRPKRVLVITVALCAVSLFYAKKVFFDYNLLNMQSRGLPAVLFQRKLIDEASKSVLYAAVMANSLADAAELEAKILKLPSVESIDSMTRYLAGEQRGKLELIGQIKRELQSIRFADLDIEPINLRELDATLQYTQGYLGTAAKIVKQEGQNELLKQLQLLQEAIRELRHQLIVGDPARDVRRLTGFQRALFSDIHETFEALKDQDNGAPLRVDDLPPALRNRFIGKTGKYLLQIYPKRNVWQREHQEEFVRELRTVDPNATGTPVELYEYTTLLKRSYEKAAWYALGAIVILVLVHFHTFSSVILALLPVGIGTLWLLGLMGYFGVPFNPANIMTLPLVIGIGVTNGIHILNRFAEEKKPSILAKSTGKAVLVSGLTTIAGFASLIPAKHQGISSLGIVMSTGVTTCMVAALTFLPALLNLMIRLGWRMKKPSGDTALSPLGREEPR